MVCPSSRSKTPFVLFQIQWLCQICYHEFCAADNNRNKSKSMPFRLRLRNLFRGLGFRARCLLACFDFENTIMHAGLGSASVGDCIRCYTDLKADQPRCEFQDSRHASTLMCIASMPEPRFKPVSPVRAEAVLLLAICRKA